MWIIFQMSENILLTVSWKVSIFPTCLHILQINFFDVFKNLSLGLYILAENLRSISIVNQIRQNIASQIWCSCYRNQEIISRIKNLGRRMIIFKLN